MHASRAGPEQIGPRSNPKVIEVLDERRPLVIGWIDRSDQRADKPACADGKLRVVIRVAIFRLRFESMTGLCVQLAWQHHQPIDHPHQVERDSDAEQSSDKRPTPQPPC
ncbi:MAG: hypothetical protein ACK559_26865, partial [bacterium]